MGILALVGFIVLVFNLCKETFEPEIPASYHRNMKLEQEDARKVLIGQMSKREFNRNIKNGKYR